MRGAEDESFPAELRRVRLCALTVRAMAKKGSTGTGCTRRGGIELPEF